MRVLDVAQDQASARHGIERLRPGRAVWIPGVLLLLWLAFQVVRPASTDDALFDDHVVTYLKLVEYALLLALISVALIGALGAYQGGLAGYMQGIIDTLVALFG